MKKTLLFCGVLMLIGASAAFAVAPGLNIGWTTDGGCWPESGTALKTFACTSNSGSAVMVASFAIGSDMADFTALGAILDGQSETASLPDWWQLFNTGSCRSTSLTCSADFTGSPQTACTDPFLGAATGAIAAYQTQLFPPPSPLNVPAANRLRIKAASLLTSNVALTNGVEYYGCRLTVNFAKTVGTPACAGCGTAVTLVLNEIQVTPTLQVNTVHLYNPITNQCLQWQGTTVDCALVPARNRTWGEVKSLYR